MAQNATLQAPSAKTFHQILESGHHLLALINDILDFSKMEAGNLRHSDDVVQPPSAPGVTW